MGSWSNLRFCNLQHEISNSSILKFPLPTSRNLSDTTYRIGFPPPQQI
jgi:hypothetical protein